jgi:hypothetical protein
MSPGLLPQAAAGGAKGIKHVKAGAYTVPASAFLSPAPVDKTAETPEQRAARKAAKAARKADKAAARQGGGDTAVPEAAVPAKKRSRDAAPGDAAPPAKAPKVERMSADAYRAAHEIKVRALVTWRAWALGGAAPRAAAATAVLRHWLATRCAQKAGAWLLLPAPTCSPKL